MNLHRLRDEVLELERLLSGGVMNNSGSTSGSGTRRRGSSFEMVDSNTTPTSQAKIAILRLASKIIRSMLGAKIIACKSAKDRTSMAITWEQAVLLREKHRLSEREMVNARNIMRVHGVRRVNVLKNTGRPFYAFNAIQRGVMPSELSAPSSTCGPWGRKIVAS